MTATQAEAVVARNQFARFRTVCRLFAPLYRAVTLAGLKGGGDTALAYGDAVDAWHYYLAHDNGGRGVVLIGHSQGAFILKRLIAAEIDGKPLAARFVGAILPGGGVDVAGGRDVGGSFSSIPLCRAAGQTGCVIAYSTFPAGAAGAVGPFGLGSEAGRTGACVDPAALDGQQTFDAYLPVLGQGTGHATIDTPFYTMPGLLSGHCVTEGDRTYLAVSVGPGPRAENAKRFLAWAEDKFPGWGLHAIDINLVIGNLVDLVAQQSKTWVARHGAR